MKKYNISKGEMLVSYTAFLTFLLLTLHSSAQYEPILDTNNVWHASASRLLFPKTEETYHLNDWIEIEGNTYITASAETPGSTGTYFHGLFREDTLAGKLYFRAALAFTPAEDTIFSPEIVAVDLGLETGQIYYQKFIRLENNPQEFSVDSVAHLVVNTGYINDRRIVEIELILDSLWQVANEGSVPWVTNGIEGDVLITTVLNQRYIEGIGSSFGLFFPVVEAYYPQHYPLDPYLHCVNLADSIIWENPHILNCQFIVLSDSDLANTAVSINVFPNPSNGIFQITKVSTAIESYSVYNSNGQELQKGRFYSSDKPFTIDLSQYERGVYHLLLRTDHGSSIYKKLLITH